MPTLEQRAETFVINTKNPVAKTLVQTLRDVLALYGRHLPDCTSPQGCGCSCGFNRVRDDA